MLYLVLYIINRMTVLIDTWWNVNQSHVLARMCKAAF